MQQSHQYQGQLNNLQSIIDTQRRELELRNQRQAEQERLARDRQQMAERERQRQENVRREQERLRSTIRTPERIQELTNSWNDTINSIRNRGQNLVLSSTGENRNEGNTYTFPDLQSYINSYFPR